MRISYWSSYVCSSDLSGEISLNDAGKLYLFHYITYLNGYPIKEDTFCSDIDGPITEKDRIDSQRFEKLGAANAQLTASGVMSFCYQGIRNFEMIGRASVRERVCL